MKILVVGLIFFLPFVCSSQTKKIENTTLRYSQLSALLANPRADTLVFDKVKFVNDGGTTTWSMTLTQDSSGNYSIWATDYIANSLTIPFSSDTTNTIPANDIQFNQCGFDDDLYFENVSFPGSISFVECYSTKNKATLLLRNCTAGNYISFNNPQTQGSNPSFWKVALESTTTDQLIIYNPGNSSIDDIQIDVQLSTVYQYLYLRGRKIYLGGSTIYLTEPSTIMATEEAYIRGNKFDTYLGTLLKFEITNSEFALYYNRFGTPVHINTYGDATKWEFFSNDVKVAIGTYIRSDIAPTSYIDFDNMFGDRPIGWYSGDSGTDSSFYDGSTEDLWEKRGYKRLLQHHKIFHEFYVSSGDIISANKVYVRMKDLETRALLAEVDVTGSKFDTAVRISLNKLLKFYTMYGTDPSRAILISIWVILAFAFLYIFFPSSWDRKPKLQLVADLRTLSERRNWTVTVAGRTSVVVLLTLINAVTLSLNSFVTLGFGDIPTRGLARYMTILEGFVGWFLLTLFSVALISQSS